MCIDCSQNIYFSKNKACHCVAVQFLKFHQSTPSWVTKHGVHKLVTAALDIHPPAQIGGGAQTLHLPPSERRAMESLRIDNGELPLDLAQVLGSRRRAECINCSDDVHGLIWP
jgi:hypothetical protein